MQKLIKQFKYRFSYELKTFLGSLLTNAIKNLPLNDFLITYIPLHKNRESWRGYNQAKLLAQEISKNLNMPIINILKRTKDTKFQSYLKKHERENNIKNSFDCIKTIDITNKNILLIDDVITTGITVNECSYILKKTGAKKIIALVIASKRD